MRTAIHRGADLSYRSPSRGFTLLELLVVMVIAGVMLGVVSFNAMPSAHQVLENEAKRIALLLQLARDEAIVRNGPVAFEADTEKYRFLQRTNNSWTPLVNDDLLRERPFQRAPVTLTITPPLPPSSAPMRIVFGREPVDKPFLLRLSVDDQQVSIRADGVGHFEVE
jgi:general secretion pathway protein H